VPLFKINFCSGQLRMQTSGLSALANPYYRLLVEVRSNSDPASAAQANVTVVVLPVPHPPQFSDTSYTRYVFENTTVGGSVLPCVVASDPDLDNITFSLASSVTSLGLVNVTSAGAQGASRPLPCSTPPSCCACTQVHSMLVSLSLSEYARCLGFLPVTGCFVVAAKLRFNVLRVVCVCLHQYAFGCL
jgi:hypothetical protein